MDTPFYLELFPIWDYKTFITTVGIFIFIGREIFMLSYDKLERIYDF